jgi:hypothetical protein
MISNGHAQTVQVEQKIDSVSILIGQQAHMIVSVTAQHGAKIVWQRFKPSQYITPGVEVVSTDNGETSEVDGMTKESKIYTLTSFDERLYAIPPIKVSVNGKQYQGTQLALKVLTVTVDTVHPNQFYPPKDVQNNPFTWADFSLMFWLSVLLVILCCVAYYLYSRLKSNKPVITRIRIVKHIPAHKKALNEIDKIKSEHMQVSENQKEYYTKLTDTVRQYIQERFGFNAMEMTSNEIIYRLRESDDQKSIDELHELFETADLVKFAKHSALINENDLNLVNAIKFIDDTKTSAEETEERIVPQLSDDEAKSQKSRMTIKSLITVIVVAAVVLFVFIIYNVYQLLG